MRNLKKVLALVLVVASLLTVASAASFTDAKSIKNTEAVGLLTDLGVVNGFTDGSYRPEGTVTRAQMAKMIYVAMTGDDDASGFNGTATTLTDVKGHWAEGYIKYCFSLGIITGFGDNSFRPDQNVTVAQAAKMLLVAIGYDANEYTGNAWSVNTMRDAKAAKITKDVSASSVLDASRDVAAQLIFNTLFADQVTPVYQYDMGVKYVTGYNKTGTTLAEDNFDMIKVSGTVTSISAESIMLTFKGEDGKPASQTVALKNGTYDMLGKMGTVYYKTEKGKSPVLYSTEVAVDEGATLLTTTDGTSVYKSAVKSDSKKVTLDDKVSVINNGSTGAATAVVDAATEKNNYTESANTGDKKGNGTGALAVTNGKGVVVEYIDTDSNGKVDTIKSTQLTPVKVTNYNTINKKMSVSKLGNATGSLNYDFDKVINVDSFAKNDICMAIEFAGKLNLYPTTMVEGTISGLVASSSSVRIDGTVYGFSAAVKEENGFDGSNTQRGAEGKFYLDSNGYIVYADTTSSASVDKMAYVNKADAVNTFNETQMVELVFTDGTKSVVEVAKYAATQKGDAEDVADSDGHKVVRGDVVTYTVSDGKYTLKKYESIETAGEVKITKGLPTTLAGKTTTASTLFVDVKGGNVYTGYANVPTQDAKKVNGSPVKTNSTSVQLVFLLDADTSSSSTKFFIFKTNAYETGKKGDTDIRTYDVLMDGEVTTLDIAESSDASDIIDTKGIGYYEGTLNSKDILSKIDTTKFAPGTEITRDGEGKATNMSYTDGLLTLADTTYITDENTACFQIKDGKATQADTSLVDDVNVAKVLVQVVKSNGTEVEQKTAKTVYFIY